MLKKSVVCGTRVQTFKIIVVALVFLGCGSLGWMQIDENEINLTDPI